MGAARQKKKPSLERELRPGSAWEVLTKKMPATSAGTKLQNKEKPAVRELLTAGVCFLSKNDALGQKEGEKPRFYAAFP